MDGKLFDITYLPGGFDITPTQQIIDIANRHDYTKLKMNSSQKMQIEALMSQLPSVVSTKALENAYILQFPEGVSGTLMKLKRGGYSTTLVGENGRFCGTASLQPLNSQIPFIGAFSAMSAASGQYFLAEINSHLTMIEFNIDKILEFLYGDKKAELLAETSFVKYAYSNYSSIVLHEQQRLASIVSLQEARKVAMKDIEFYIVELNSIINDASISDINRLMNHAFQIKDSLELSLQLYLLSTLLEVYYSDNYDREYIEYIEQDISIYIAKCEKRILSAFVALRQNVQGLAAKPFKRSVKIMREEELFKTIDRLSSGEESSMQKFLHEALSFPTKRQEYYIADDGVVYLKTE